jgi:hypothetical protein
VCAAPVDTVEVKAEVARIEPNRGGGGCGTGQRGVSRGGGGAD